jgi:arginase
MPLRHLLGDGDAEVLSVLGAPVSRAGVRLVGARSLDPEEQHCIEAEGLVHVGAAVREAAEARDLADRLVPRSAPLYLHVDLDILDPSDFPGLCCPEPHGWSPDALTAFCSRAIQRGSLVGMGVMEYLPRRGGELKPLAGFLDLLRATAST